MCFVGVSDQSSLHGYQKSSRYISFCYSVCIELLIHGDGDRGLCRSTALFNLVFLIPRLTWRHCQIGKRNKCSRSKLLYCHDIASTFGESRKEIPTASFMFQGI